MHRSAMVGHAILLAQRGYLVTGQDLSGILLAEAQKAAKEYYGSLDKSRLTLNSNRLTIIAQKSQA